MSDGFYRERLRREQRQIESLRIALCALASAAGGEITVSRRELQSVRPDDELAFIEDVDNRCVRIRNLAVPRPLDRREKKRVERMPDWML